MPSKIFISSTMQDLQLERRESKLDESHKNSISNGLFRNGILELESS
jgi:hypothetical protein